MIHLGGGCPPLIKSHPPLEIASLHYIATIASKLEINTKSLRMDQKRSQTVRNLKFSGGACPQTPLVYMCLCNVHRASPPPLFHDYSFHFAHPWINPLPGVISGCFPFWLVSTFILILPSLPVSLLPSSYLNHRTSSRRSQSRYQIKCKRSK